MTKHAAFQALASLAALSRKSASGLPAQADVAPRWSGVGFSFMGHKFVTPMGTVTELMELPDSTRLPGVQPWVIGLSNVRGRLLPLFDFAKFFGGSLNVKKKYHRVLVLETESLYSGIVVDMVYGMQHFEMTSYQQFDGGCHQEIAPFVTGAYENTAKEKWLVFDMTKLAEDARFINAAL